jgi:FkbM family methyltransferase
MKSVAHSLLGRMGIRAFRLKTLPYGADEIHDVSRLASGPLRVVFDIGANVGDKSVRYARAFPEARVYAFEPFEAAFQSLRANTAAEPRVEAIKLAMGAARGTQMVERMDGTSQANSLQAGLNRSQSAGTEEIRIETVDDFCDDRKIDVIDYMKSDTEGYELQVLEGARRMLAGQRIKLVLIECAFDAADRRHTNFFDLYQVLTGHGYQFLGLSETLHTVSGKRKIDYTNALFGS